MKKALCCVLFALLVAGCGNEKVTDKHVSVIVSNGQTRQGLYTGELNKDGKPEGKGIFKTKNAKGTAYTYTGGFRNGAYDGNAVLQYEDGFKLETIYKDGNENGQSKLFKNDKIVFEGEMTKGKRNGKGKYYNQDGQLVYEGDFKNDNPNGTGKFYKKDGSVWYEGNVVDGFPSKPPVKMNVPVSYADWEYSVTHVQELGTIKDTPPSGKYLAVFLTIKNNSNVARQIDNFFVLNDNRTRIFNANTKAMVDYQFSANLGKDWYLSEVNPGIALKNIPFIFDIPKDAQGLKLIPKQGVAEAFPILLQ